MSDGDPSAAGTGEPVPGPDAGAPPDAPAPVSAPDTTPGPKGPTTLWHRKALDRGELLSRELAPDVLADRWSRRYDGPAGTLNRWVDHVRLTTYESVPYADPASATAGARVLVLMQDPPGDADDGSGFLSVHNNDVTSANLHRACERAKLDLSIMLLWNVVPWWVANPARPPRDLLREAVRAGPYLDQCVELLDPVPGEVVLLGRPAHRAWDRLARRHGLPDVLAGATVARAPSPGPLVYGRVDAASGRANGDLIVEALRAAGQRARGEKARPPAGGPAGRRRPF